MSVSEDNPRPQPRLRLELLVAAPPTAKCRRLIAMLEEIASSYPDQTLLHVYHAGSQPAVTPSRGYRVKGKFKKVPSLYVNGDSVDAAVSPAELRLRVEEELARGPGHWQE
jgi:hypothetical protein